MIPTKKLGDTKEKQKERKKIFSNQTHSNFLSPGNEPILLV